MVTNFEVTGLKTGSTSLAKYCLSATGRKDGVDLIAVILAAPDYKARFADAVTLLNYGFANCHLYKDDQSRELCRKRRWQAASRNRLQGVCGEPFLTFRWEERIWMESKRVDDGRILQSAGSGR